MELHFLRMNFRTLLVIIVLSGCVKEIKPHIRNTEPILVVEGLLLTYSTPCKVNLSYSGAYTAVGYLAKNELNDAQVFLKDDLNDSIQLISKGNGDYRDETNQIVPVVGHSYFLTIRLSNGERYASVPENVLPVPKDFDVDSVGTGYPFKNPFLHGAKFFIKAQDPGDETNYYRWIANGYIPRKSLGEDCGFAGRCRQYCYQYYEEHYISIQSDQKFNGNQIRFQDVLTSPFYWYGKHYMEIKQLSLTKQGFQFWEQYSQQTQRTGTIVDPLPSSIQGNIYNADKPSEFALGYFEVSDAVSKKIIIDPFFIYPQIMEMPAQQFIIDGACEEVYPNAKQSAPPGWQNAPVYALTIRFF
jgi:hypothetical protein